MAPTRSKRIASAALIAAIILLLAPAVAAETVMVLRRARVKSRPNRDADTVMRVKEDRPARLLRRGDGWVKVRIGDEVGWIRQSQIEEEEAEDEALDEDQQEVVICRPGRGRGRRRRPGGR